MRAFTDVEAFRREFLAYAAELGWSLKLEQRDVPMRWAYTWIYRDMTMPEQLVLVPNRADAELLAVFYLERHARWDFVLRTTEPSASAMELEPAPGIVRQSVSAEEISPSGFFAALPGEAAS